MRKVKVEQSLGVRGRILPHPSFTLKDLRDKIPPHLFEAHLSTSLLYLAWDLLLSAFVAFTAYHALAFLPAWAVFPVYWIVQGGVWTGLWVLAHECGHGAFSRNQTVNNVVGLVLHSFLLVPYHSWRISHASHHKNTNHLELDTVFVAPVGERATPSAPVRAVQIVMALLLGWPMYLFFNFSGRKYDASATNGRVNHFEPSSPVFQPNQRNDVLVSDVGIITMLGLMAAFAYNYGFGTLVAWHVVPYLIVNFWLVLITFLQHTDKRCPKFKGSEFSFVRAAIGSVDRDFGIGNVLFHHITDSHVVHHLFSTMPFYHAIQATPYVKAFLGEYYNYDNRSVAKCLWEEFRDCTYVGENADAVLWKRREGSRK